MGISTGHFERGRQAGLFQDQWKLKNGEKWKKSEFLEHLIMIDNRKYLPSLPFKVLKN